MRRWLADAREAADEVAGRPTLWLPGALAWVLTFGWLALLIGVATPPTTAELTFIGARLVTSGAWPWNAVAIAAGAAVLVVAIFMVCGAVEAVLVRGPRATLADAVRVAALGMVCAVPAVVGVFALAAVAPAVLQAEFNAPAGIAPLLRSAERLGPLLVAIVLAWVVGAGFHAAAARVTLGGRGVRASLVGAPTVLARPGIAAPVQAAVLFAAKTVYLVVAAMLLRVLWDPIGARLASDGMGPSSLLLLVGFVAIWLCLVLGGGALHAWGSVSWSRVLRLRSAAGGPVAQMETHRRS